MRSPAIVIATPLESDHRVLRELIEGSGWPVRHCWTCESVVRHLTTTPMPVVIAHRDLPEGGWRKLLDLLWTMEEPAQLVVYSALADDRLWAEVLNVGGYDVVSTPFCQREIQHVVRAASDAWQRQYRPVRVNPNMDALPALARQYTAVL